MAKCRICGETLPARPLLRYPDMPSSAQGFTDDPGSRAGRGVDLALCQCAACGMIQLDNPPVSGHRDVVRASAYSAQMREFRQSQFADWVFRHRLSGRTVVEIGCGRGEYLALLNETGARACGVEHAADAVRACRGLGLKATRAYPSRRRQTLPGAPFDGFMTLNFLEHWPDPIGGLRTVARSLADRGVGLVEVPNFDMVVGAGMFAELCADHLLYFTADTLRFALQCAGFEVLDCRAVWHDYILSAEVRKRPILDVAPLERRRTQVTDDLRRFIARFPPGQVAVWGAGHQAQAVISLTGIAGDIRYVIDSAPFKQGRYLPAGGVRVVAPETLRSEPVQAVVVMAASYCDEVAARLRRDFDPALTVATLRDHGLESP